MPALLGSKDGPFWCADCKTDQQVKCSCGVWALKNELIKQDMVNSPPHYTRLTPQPIDVIEAWNLDFHLAQVLKYIARAGKKDAAKEREDLEKAAFYLNRRINQLRKK